MSFNEGVVQMRLSRSKRIDAQAVAFSHVMTSQPDRPHENESLIKVERKGNLAFSIHAHRRQVIARYSQVFVKDDTTPKGRYEFIVLPEEYSAPSAAPTMLFHFEFGAMGEFMLGEREFACDPDDLDKAFLRNSVINFVVGTLQEFLSV